MPRFLKAIRQQLLMWRILTGEDYARYEKQGKIMFDEKTNFTKNNV